MQEIFVPAIAISRGTVAPENKEVLWEDISNMSLPFFERIKSYDSNTTQWRMVTQLPLELLNSLKKVDGDGSGLDANFLQGRTVNDIIQLAKDGSFTLPNGFIFIGNNLGEAEAKALSGDATLQSNGNLTLASSGVVAGTYNLASLTIDAKGRITNAVSYTISVSDIPELPQSKITGLVTDLSNRELIANKENSLIDTSTTKYPTVNLLKIGLDAKQDTLVSGTNIKTLNGNSLLGAGNIEIISENLATNNLNLPATTERTFNIPSDSTLDFGALMKLYGTGTVDFTSDVTVDNVQFKGGVGTQGEMSWSTDEETVKLIMDGTTLYLGQDTFVHVRNNTASIITKGTAVYATGTLGASGRITVAPMIADGTIPGRLFIGLAAENIAIGADGQVITFGKIRQIDTTAYNDGDVLWLSPTVAGGLTATEPTAPNLKIATAFVIHDASNGTLMVRAEQGNDLHSDQRVQVSGLTNNDVLTWNNANQRWQNAQPVSSNIYTSNGTIGTTRVATLTDTLSFSGGRVSFDTTTNGILLPRLTTIQMNAIASPTTNTILYNTDLNGLYRYNGSAWVALSSGYGIIEVQSGTGTGQPTYFADLQSALETCKASGGYFTVKLYSNLTITTDIYIDYTGSGVGFAYQFRQLTIDFNGFSITNAQANTTNAFDIRLSNTASVYQEVRLINGNILRTNGTGTHHAVKCDQTTRFGTMQMSKMHVYCENSFGAIIDLGISTQDGANRVCDLGNSTFVSKNGITALRLDGINQTVTNFNAISTNAGGAGLWMRRGVAYNFFAENTSGGDAISVGLSEFKRMYNFVAKANTGHGIYSDANNLDIVLQNFITTSNSGIALRANNAITLNGFTAITGNNLALRVEGLAEINNGKCVNNSASECIYLVNVNSATNLDGKNLGSGVGFRVFTNTSVRSEIKDIKAVSIGGVGGVVASNTLTTKLSNCQFISEWNNAGGHALFVEATSGGQIQISNSNFGVKNASANVLNASGATTVRVGYNTHNNVASTPVNANITLATLGKIDI